MGHRGSDGSRTPDDRRGQRLRRSRPHSARTALESGHHGSGTPDDDASEWIAGWRDESPWPGGQEWQDAPGDGYADWHDDQGGEPDDGSLADLARGATARGPAQGYPLSPDHPDPVYPGDPWNSGEHPQLGDRHPSGEHAQWEADTGPNAYMPAPWEGGGHTGQRGTGAQETQWGQASDGGWDAAAPHTGQYDAAQIANWDGGHSGEWNAHAGTGEWDPDAPHTGQWDANQIANWDQQGASWDAAEGHWVETEAPDGYDDGEYADEQDFRDEHSQRRRKRRRRRAKPDPADLAAAAPAPAAVPVAPVPTRKRGGRTGRGGGSRTRTIILAAAGVVIVAALGATAYTFLGGRTAKTNANSPSAVAKLPATQPSVASTSGASKLGKWGHISSRSTDPTPLSLTETFPAQFLINGVSFIRTADRLDKDCTQALFGSGLQEAAKSNGCSQVVRGSYISADQKMMGTIGVANLSTSNGAAKAGQASGPNDFVTPLVSKSGPTKNLSKGTGVVQAEYKGHYLILIWAEFANLKAPSSSSARSQLEQFSSDLISGSANIALSNRMVNGSKAGSG